MNTVNTANQIRIMKNQVLIMHSLEMIIPAVVNHLNFSVPGSEKLFVDPRDAMVILLREHIMETNEFITGSG